MFFWLHWAFVVALGLPLVGGRGHFLWCAGFTTVTFLTAEPGSRRVRQWLCALGGCVHRRGCSTACGIFPSQGIPCTGRWILNLWMAREVHITALN